jgi:hypothetical protein
LASAERTANLVGFGIDAETGAWPFLTTLLSFHADLQHVARDLGRHLGQERLDARLRAIRRVAIREDVIGEQRTSSVTRRPG